MTGKMYTIGKIINTHGIRGEVKVLRITDFAERFTIGETVHLEIADKEPLQAEIVGHRVHKGFDLLRFNGFDDINMVEPFKGSYVKITEDQLTELKKDEYYYHEIIGCTVYTTENEELGVIKEILAPGANDVWVIQRQKQKDLLIPYIADVVKTVDLKAKRVTIMLMEGLLD